MHVMGVTERDERKKGAESLSRGIVTENIPNLGRNLEIQEIWRFMTLLGL